MKFSIPAAAFAVALCVATALITQNAWAQYSQGPAFSPNMGGRGDTQMLRLKRCFDHHRSPSDRADSCRRLLDDGGTVVDVATVAQDYVEAGRYDDAQALLDARLAVAPRDRDAQVTVAILEAAQGRNADAMRTMDGIPGKDSAFVLSNRCWLRAIAGQELDSDLADCDKAIALEPKESSTRDSRGLANFKRGDMKAAIADFDASIALHANISAPRAAPVMDSDAALDALTVQAGTYYMRGLAKTRAGDADGGAKDIEIAKDLDPYVDDEYTHYGVTP